jgi:hypothetical protein
MLPVHEQKHAAKGYMQHDDHQNDDGLHDLYPASRTAAPV